MINTFPPTDKEYTYLQVNRGDDIGSIWSSMNLDLQSNLGQLRLAPRLILNTSTLSNALGLPTAYCEFDDGLWALAGNLIYRTATTTPEPNEAFTADTSTGAKTNYDDDESDMTTFDGRLFASNDDGLYAKSSYAGAWSQITATPTAGLLQYFRKFDRLYISQGSNSIESLSNADVYASSGDYTITLAADQIITSMCETSDSIWIGTINSENLAGRASVFRWDGISAQATERYYIEANEVCSLVTKNDIPFSMDSDGVLRQFTGSSFDEVGRIPFGVGDKLPKGTGTAVGNPRYIHRRGMVSTKDDTILCLIRNIYEDVNRTIPENVPSGVWEWSKDFGFIHKYSFTFTPRETSTITDYGQNRVWAVGALASMNTGDDSSDRNGSLLAGAEYFDDNSDSTAGNFAIFYDDSNDVIQKKGYFVTSWFNSLEIQDKWERLWVVYRRFLDSGDSIVFKYRLYEEDPTYINITWTSTTTFTTTTNVTAYGPTATGFNGTVGGEVEFTQGTGSAACVHITNISEAGGTYTVTVDTAVTGVTTGTGKARLQKWIRLNPVAAQDQIKSFSQMQVGASNTRIQIKGCLTFTGAGEFTKAVLVSNSDIKISQ